ncbi:MAG: effector-associated domain 2-containing protein, partial [Spirillospora sp.]
APPLDTAEGRDALVAALPDGLRARIQRRPEAMMDAYCILRPCLDDTRGRSALLRALGGLPLPPTAFDDLQDAISELP